MSGGAVIQFASTVADADSTVVFGSAPANGNTLIAMLTFWNNNPTADTGWTLDFWTNASDYGVALAWKVAGAGESATQHPFNVGASPAGGTTFVWEVSGLTGVWATDKQSTNSARDVVMTTAFTSSSVNTAATNTGVLGILSADVLTGTTETAGPVITGGNTPSVAQSYVQNNGANRHSAITAISDFFPLSVSAVAYTATFNTSQQTGQYVLLLLNGWAPPSAFMPRTIVY